MSLFSSILSPKIKKSVFDLSYENKLSFNMGDLVPIYFENVVPGDKFRVNSEVFLRFAPLIAPIMHRVNCYVHYFYVPNRLVWDDWQEFITGGEDGLSEPLFPRRPLIRAVGGKSASEIAGAGSLLDFLGYNAYTSNPDGSETFKPASLLPLRAYQFIYNEFYRDQNLQDPVIFSKRSGSGATYDNILIDGDSDTDFSKRFIDLVTLRKRAWEKDYFTSALPFVQRGVEARLPLTSEQSGISVKEDSVGYIDDETVRLNRAKRTGGSTTAFGDDIYVREDGTLSSNGEDFILGASLQPGIEGHNHRINIADIADQLQMSGDILGPSINELRLANHLQKWLEKNARGGARYVEQILSHFGVRVPDYRLDRPEYLGGGKSPVVISEVLQTSESNSTPQGNMSGHAYSVGSKNSFKYRFDEHGMVFGILSVLPRTTYQQGLSRHLTKFDKFDFYFPEFANLGEQAVLNKEVYNAPTLEYYDPDGTFGYQERYAEYKYRSSEVHGDFKDSLNMWHLGRIFDNPPLLNTSFVQSNPSDRVFAVESGVDHLWCQVYNNVRAVRPMPRHAIPSL